MTSTSSNSIVHIDISGPEAGQLETFYRDVFGWQIDSKGPGYSLVHTPEGGPDGAIIEAPRPSVIVGVAVDDLVASVAQALAAGGSQIMPVTDNGWVRKAQVADPMGNVVTLIQR